MAITQIDTYVKVNETDWELASTTAASEYAVALTTDAGSASKPVYFVNGKPTECTSISLDTSGNAGSATKLKTARAIDGVEFDGSVAISHYGTCSTAAGTQEKAVSLSNFTLVTGAIVTVKFSNTNTASNPTLNVNSKGAKAIFYRGAAISADALAKNRVYTFVYDGTQFQLIGDLDTDTAATTYSVMTGASTSAAGSSGLVPAPAKGDATRYLRCDGTWQVPPDNDTTYSVATTSANGLMSSTDKAKLNGISASNTTPEAPGTANKGSETAYARGDHVHPAQTDITGLAAKATADADGNTISTTYAKKSDIPTAQTDITGNAATASKLKSAVTLWGQSFDGSNNVSGEINSVPHIEFTGTTSSSGHGGYIDFHFCGNSDDYTSRIIEKYSGLLYITGKLVVYGDLRSTKVCATALYGCGEGTDNDLVSSSSGIECGAGLHPIKDDTFNLGTSPIKWANLYLNNNPVVSSDRRIKENISSIDDAVLDIWEDVKFYQYKFIGRKTPRLHIGLIVQDIKESFDAKNIDISDYGFYCYDSWEAQEEQKDESGNIIQEAREAGDSYSMRYEEALCIEAAYQRRRADRLEKRLFQILCKREKYGKNGAVLRRRLRWQDASGPPKKLSAGRNFTS